MRQISTLAVVIGLTVTSAASAQVIQIDTPSDDRWHYPFNFTPGTRATGSCFGVAGTSNFNDRDGIVIAAWDTSTEIQPGLGPDAYPIESVTVTLTNQSGAEWAVDLTTDEWFTFDLNGDGAINADGIPRGQPGDTDGESDDADPGRPLELFGAGFGPTYTAASWVETSLYEGSDGAGDLPRDPFPFVYQDGTLQPLHVEDSVKGLHNAAAGVTSFTPTAWAIGVPQAYTPGSQSVPFDVAFEMDLGLSNGAVRRYFQEQLDAGRVVIVVTSLQGAQQQGPQSGFPSFFMKEGLILDPGAKAADLRIVSAQPGEPVPVANQAARFALIGALLCTGAWAVRRCVVVRPVTVS